MKNNRGIEIREDWVFRRGDIYLANLNPFTGSEQGGKRPVLVLQNNEGNYFSETLIIAPLTTKVKKMDMPTHCYIAECRALEAPSVVMLEQIRTISKLRISKYLGKLDKKQMDMVADAAMTSLGIEIPEGMEAP